MVMRLGVAVAFALLFCMLAPMTGVGASSWHTVRAAGDRNITIDIPAAVEQEPVGTLVAGDLMAFFGKSTGKTNVLCPLSRNEYTSDLTRAQWIAGLAGPNAGMFCGTKDSGSGFEMMDLESTTSNGFPASTCVSSYTQSGGKEPGRVHSQITVAAPQALYTFTCEASDESQAGAEVAWRLGLNDEVAHMQASLHLVDSKK
jgi:hypothetical protein